MKINTVFFILLATILSITGLQVSAQTKEDQQTQGKSEISADEKLAIIWTSGDREVALKMVFMYTLNSKKFKWWEDITLVVWGPSAKLLTEDMELQNYMKQILDAGVVVKACKGCSDQYGVSEKLQALGIEVKYMGEITDYIKEGRHILTF